MTGTDTDKDCFAGIMKTIFSEKEDEITCSDCFDHVDQYVDMLREGRDPAVVLPHVKEHLECCHCCKKEFEALITILEAQTDDNASTG